MRTKTCMATTQARAARPAHRPPEVIIKVIIPGSHSVAAIRQHLVELQKGHGRVMETDFFNNPVRGRKGVAELIDDWDLDLEELLCQVGQCWDRRRRCKKLVHKIIFSMPAGTPPDRLLAAVRDFAEKLFAPRRHLYALALHTDEPHPHVHMVLKAVSEECERLHIRKATLHGWRQAFARHLREQGVAAKATSRSNRKEAHISKLKGIYRPTRIPHPTPHRDPAHALC